MAEYPHAVWQGWQGPTVFVHRLLWGGLVWWVLTDGAVDSWFIGVPAVTAAAALSTALLPPLRWSWRGVVGFLGFFLVDSLRGGIDVAARALHWRLPLDPGVVQHRVRLTLPAARVSMANTASLLPGTLVANVEGDCLYVHVLATGRQIAESLEKAERHVALLFGEPHAAPEGGHDHGAGGGR